MKARVLLIDNYDSFTYNLVQALRVLDAEVVVHRHDEISPSEALGMKPSHLVLSPGPGRPEDAGICIELIHAFREITPILGVCLGHQAIAAAHGMRVSSAQSLMHGKSSRVYHDSRTLYQGLPNPFAAGRYHSLAVEEESLTPEFLISAYTSDGEIMGLRHRLLPIEGVQFHPESILSPEGDRLLQNFLDLAPADPAP